MTSVHIRANHLMNTTVLVQRREQAPDGMGGQESDWQDLATYPARISQPATGGQAREYVTAAQATRTITQRVYFLPGVDVIRGDRVLTLNGRTLAVEAIIEPSEPVYRRADCREDQEGI